MKTIGSLLLLLVLPLALRAQATVRGHVVDQHNGIAVVGALVTVTGTSLRVNTDKAGAFTLAAPGAISSLTVAAVGFEGKVVIVSSTDESLRIELIGLPAEMPGIEVVAGRPAPSTALLTRSDLDRFSGLALSDAVNTVPGVFMQSRTPFGGAHIDIRGYYPSVSGNSPNSNGMGANVFLNGIPITDASGTTVLDDVDFATLGRVEIIKGPASSLYGGAIGGTVLLGTARPAPNQTSAGVQYLGGGDGLMRFNTSLQGANGTSDYVLNYGHQAYDSWRPHSESRKTYARGTGDFQVGTNQSLTAYFSYNKSYEELAGEIDSTDFYSRNPVSDANYLANNSHIQLTSYFTGLSDTYQISEHFSNQTSVFGSGRFANQPFAHGFTDATQFNVGARSAIDFSGQAGQVGISGTVGIMAQRSTVTSNGVFIVPAPPFAERPSASENSAVNSFAFTEWKFAFPSQFTVTAGGSYINNSFSVHNMLKSGALFDTTTTITKSFDAVFAPRIEVTKGFADNALLYASVSTGYTPPLLTNITASDGTVNTGLKPEHAMQYEVGLQGRLLKHLSGQLALYDLDNTDKLINQTVATITSTTNVGEQRNEGAEVSLSWLARSDSTRALSLVRPWISYTYTDAKYIDFKSDNNNTAATVDFSGNRVARVPKTRYAIGLDAGTHNGFSLNGTYQFVGDVPVTFDNSTSVHSYSLLSARAGYRTLLNHHWNLELAVGGDNLTKQTYYTFLFVGPNYKGLAQGPDGGSGDGYILPGNPSAQLYASIGLSYVFR
jgi:iron complex outermembrane receptor protein